MFYSFMNTTVGDAPKRVEDYLRSTLHISPCLEEWSGARKLPIYFQSDFEFRITEILEQKILFAFVRDREEATPSKLSRRMRSLEEFFDGIPVLAPERLSTYQRDRLIALGTAFVVPGNQLHIPQLAVSLKEFHRKKLPRPGDRLSPVAQALLLRHLNEKDVDGARPSDLARMFRCSPMSVGRAFGEFESKGLARIRVLGRNKHVEFKKPPREIFEEALPWLRSPVRSTRFFRAGPVPGRPVEATPRGNLRMGGETALSEMTMLSPPPVATYAAGPLDWKKFRSENSDQTVDLSHEPDYSIELWWYDPTSITGGSRIDALSLFLQFRDHPDERVSAAAERILEEHRW